MKVITAFRLRWRASGYKGDSGQSNIPVDGHFISLSADS
jgi:hypothetical protein